MSREKNSRNSIDNLPCTETHRQGAKLGVWASLFASVIFLLAWPLTGILIGEELVTESLLTDRQEYLIVFMCFYWTLGLFMTFLTSLLPGVVAGVGNAVALEAFATKGILTIIRGIIVGALIGGIAGFIIGYPGTLLMMNLVVDVYPPEEAQAFTQIFFSVVLAGIIAGSWHGWKMSRLLSNQSFT